MKKRTTKLLATGVIASAIMATTLITAFADNNKLHLGQKADPVNPTLTGEEYELPEDAYESIEEFLKKQTGLTDTQKQMLVDEDKALIPIYEKLDQLDQKIEEKTREVLKGADPQFDERAKLFEENKALWEKIESSSNEEQKNAKKYADYIKASKTLTDGEKEILLKAQKRIDELDAIIDTFYAKAEEETKDLRTQQEDELEKLHVIQEKTQPIWDQIYSK